MVESKSSTDTPDAHTEGTKKKIDSNEAVRSIIVG